MSMVTAGDIARAVAQLPRNRDYHYIERATRTRIVLEGVVLPYGPIIIRRYNPTKGQGRRDASRSTISSQMIWRVAAAFREGVPVNMDRVLGGSYNTRSAFEVLLAHTPQFYYCYPRRIELTTSSSKIKPGHKHLVWLPDDPHPEGVLVQKDTEIIISEIPTLEAIYEALVLPETSIEAGIDIDVARRHAQIQIALIQIGTQLGFRTWIAHNDKGIVYNNRRIGEMENVLARLADVKLLAAFEDARRAAAQIDCIWFKNSRLMPAVIEIEHSTGVRSGLSRMKNFFDTAPPVPARWVIAAPDEDREKVMRECNLPQFTALNARYFPYSAVEELYYLCQKRKIRGVSEEFLDSYMERCVPSIESSSNN